jgi:protein TonB
VDFTIMGREPISAPEFELGRLPVTPRRTTARRILLVAAALSVAVHILAALLIVFLPRVLPQDARQKEQGTVELLMVEKQGAQPSEAGQPQEQKPTPPQPQKQAQAPKPEPKKTETPETEAKAVPAPPVPEAANVPAPPPTEQAPPKETKAEEKPDVKQAPVQPTPPASREAPVFDLAGTESESNAVVLGGQVIPASPDNRFRNRPPIYPRQAAMLDQSGTVDLMIHVSDTGVAIGVDVLQSSGVESLDQAAIDAVMKWRFHPALKEGRSVPFDMPFRFIFGPD